MSYTGIRQKNSSMNLIIKEVASEMGINAQEVMSVVNSEFRFLSEEIESSEGHPVWLPYLGIFYISQSKWRKYFEEGWLEQNGKSDVNK